MDAAFHFSVEEYIMREIKPVEPVLMLWQTVPTVMLGANQIAAAEIDLALVKTRNICIVRRSSGGGTIYTDPGTLLYTIIRPWTAEDCDPKDVVRAYLAHPVMAALRGIGITAVLEGRNDIVIDGRKFSGIAQFIRHGYLCSHGSLLYDADLDALGRILTVDEGKIAAKALRSVRSRVTNISEHLTKPLPLRDFRAQLLESWAILGDLTTIELTTADIEVIERIRLEKYASDDWNIGRTPAFTFTNAVRFSGGRVAVSLRAEKGRIAECRTNGDFLSLLPISELEAKLTGLPYRREDVADALDQIDLKRYLGGISAREFLTVFFPS
jgi:lipoate-protein ligase A